MSESKIIYEVGWWSYIDWESFGFFTEKENAQKIAKALRAKVITRTLDVEPEEYKRYKLGNNPWGKD